MREVGATSYKRWWQAYQQRKKQKRKWNLKPQSPEQCPSCQTGVEMRQVNVEPAPPIQSWSERKGRGGRQKVIDAQGFACTQTTCEHVGIRDARIHALVGDGKRGATDTIQRLRCQTCGDRFTTRRETVLHHLKTPVERILTVVETCRQQQRPVFDFLCQALTAYRAGQGAEIASELKMAITLLDSNRA